MLFRSAEYVLTALLPPSTSGSLWVKVVDTDRTRGNSNNDTLTVALIEIEGTGDPGDPVDLPPVVTITGPADGSSIDVNAPITFTADAIDAVDGDISADIVWNSNINGQIGSGASASSSTLSLGEHVISATVDDWVGNTANDSVTVTVFDPDVQGSITLTAENYKQKGVKNVVLSWEDSVTGRNTYDIYRNSDVVSDVTQNPYAETLGKGGGTYVYKVCPAGSTSDCSNEVTVVF